MSANDRQVGGEHYKAPGKVEHWDIVVQHDLNYFEAQILRYVMRCRKKKGLEDLQKAQHFIEKYIEVFHEIDRLPPTHVMVPLPLPRTQVAMDIEYEAQLLAGFAFDADGFLGSGHTRYQCKSCRQSVSALSPLGAAAVHRCPAPAPALPVACPGLPGT